MNILPIFNSLQRLGLKVLHVNLYTNKIRIEAYETEEHYRPKFNMYFEINDKDEILLDGVDKTIGYWDNTKQDDYDDRFVIGEKRTYQLSEFLLFVEELIKKYSSEIKKIIK